MLTFTENLTLLSGRTGLLLMLQHEPTVAIGDVDTAKNEPSKHGHIERCKLRKCCKWCACALLDSFLISRRQQLAFVFFV